MLFDTSGWGSTTQVQVEDWSRSWIKLIWFFCDSKISFLGILRTKFYHNLFPRKNKTMHICCRNLVQMKTRLGIICKQVGKNISKIPKMNFYDIDLRSLGSLDAAGSWGGAEQRVSFCRSCFQWWNNNIIQLPVMEQVLSLIYSCIHIANRNITHLPIMEKQQYTVYSEVANADE